jgi:hypothetical protein
MISFDSTNINYKLAVSDGLDIAELLTDNDLNIIFSKYLNLMYEQNLENSYIEFHYIIKTFEFNNILTDNELSNMGKLYLAYYCILSEFNSAIVKVITSLNNPQNITIIFSNDINDYNKAHIVEANISEHYTNIDAISYFTINQMNFDPIDSEIKILKTTNTYSPIGTFFANYLDPTKRTLGVMYKKLIPEDE